TSGIKATVVDESGTIKAKSNRKYPMHGLDKNHRELDPLQVWNETKIAISEILNQIDSSEIDYLTTTSLGEAIIPINKYGKPLMRSILGSDIRGEEELIWLCKKIDPNELIQITGLNLSTIYSINKILYIRNHFPDVYKKTYKFAYAGAWRTVKPEYAAHLHRSMSHTQTGVSRTLL
ncbi:MAG: FGGY family carbohydrate kinase, partial [Anaerolineaceae bacterium]